MGIKNLRATWPAWAGRAALGWSAAYATGAAIAALGPRLGYSIAHKGRGTGAEWALTAVYAATALLAYVMLRRPGLRWPPRVAWAVVALCLMSGFGFLLTPIHLLAFLSRNQPPVDWAGLANQGVAVAGAVLWACAALAYQRHARGVCPYCGNSGHTNTTRPVTVGHRTRAGLLGAAALLPYVTLKTAWALGATVGYTGDGRPGIDPEYTSNAGIWLYDHGVDITAVLALIGMALAFALTRPWGERLPRLPLIGLGWAGAGALAPFGIFLLVFGALTWAGVIEEGKGPESHAPWVVVVAYGGFSLYGLALARATHAYRLRTRRDCQARPSVLSSPP
ncbi:hypothetical protein [Streptomyces spiramyceticus]|uniref:hypothetical protein n=1 Tax=Streptomyces spiramyceticus TaxID=299717 RepID=UPI00237A165E|nr:hypothetical protein [Streptomyces spiramyceticus]